MWEDFKTFMWVRYFNFRDLLRTIFHYYWRSPRFALADIYLLLSYFFKSPYRIAREYNQEEPYGETPLVTLDAIVNACPLKEGDVAYELGSGRGRACLWLALYKGIQTVGIEYIPEFVERAQKVRARNVEFRCEDILKADLRDATWIYLFGSALSDDTIKKLTHRLEKLKAGTKIITISYPLTDYTHSGKIVVLDTIEVEFTWGKTIAYIQEVKGE